MQDAFSIAVVIFAVSNIGAMGLELNPREALKDLRSIRAIGPFLLWGWVVGPALAWLIIRIIPLMEAHAAGLLLISLAPTAPFFPLMVRKACGDMSFAASFMMLTTMPAGWLADKKGHRLPIMLGFLFEFLAMMTFVRVNDFIGYAAAWALFGLGVGLMSPAYQSLISKAVPEKMRNSETRPTKGSETVLNTYASSGPSDDTAPSLPVTSGGIERSIGLGP